MLKFTNHVNNSTKPDQNTLKKEENNEAFRLRI